MICYAHIDSPVGPLLLAANDDGPAPDRVPCARAIRCARCDDWREGDNARAAHRRAAAGRILRRHAPATSTCRWRRRARRSSARYGTTLATIPYGETISYAQLAQRVGRPAAVRAVGAANGRNPLPHRAALPSRDRRRRQPDRLRRRTADQAVPAAAGRRVAGGDDDLFALSAVVTSTASSVAIAVAIARRDRVALQVPAVVHHPLVRRRAHRAPGCGCR